jgi:hypothetical protein
VAAEFVEENDTLFLRVKNLGAADRFRARLTFKSGISLRPTRADLYGIWDQARGHDAEIFTGESCNLVIGSISARSQREIIYGFSWRFNYLDGSDKNQVTTEDSFNRNYLEHRWEKSIDDPEAEIVIEIFAGILPQPIIKTVLFKGAAWRDPSVATPLLVRQEAIERLREILPTLERAVIYACEYVIADLWIPANRDASHAVNFEFLQIYLVPPCRHAIEAITVDLRAAVPLESIVTVVQDMLRKYAILVSYIVRVGIIIFGEDRFYSSEGCLRGRQDPE